MSAILSLDLGVKTTVHCSDKKTTTFGIMDDAPPLEKIEEKRVDMTKPVGPIMGRGMLWGREKRKEEPLKNSEGPAAKRARMMVSGLSEAKTMAKKDSADVINEFVDNIPDDGDEIRGVARISGLLLEIRALVRKHQVEKFSFTRVSFPSKLGLKTIVSKDSRTITRLEIYLSMHRNPGNMTFKMSIKLMKSLFAFISTR